MGSNNSFNPPPGYIVIPILSDKMSYQKRYTIYNDMKWWLHKNSIGHKFLWDNTGMFFPSAIVIEQISLSFFSIKFSDIFYG